jgi:hypothetical protein
MIALTGPKELRDEIEAFTSWDNQKIEFIQDGNTPPKWVIFTDQRQTPFEPIFNLIDQLETIEWVPPIPRDDFSA